MMRRRMIWFFAFLAASANAAFQGKAQGTRLWTVGRFEEMERGTSEGVAIRGDGVLEAGPGSSLVAATGANYVWAVAPGPAGETYAGTGGTTQGSAEVLRIGDDGKPAKVFAGSELAVQALRVAADGTLFFATSPDGKVYRLAPGAAAATVIFDPAQTAEKPKYLWDLALIGGDVFVAAGAPAAVYRIPASAGASKVQTPFFKTADQHIRCLVTGPGGILWAGSDGAGVIYRINPAQPGAKPYAAYAAPRREITSLAVDGAGNVFAAGVGTRGASTLPPLPVTGATGVSITFVVPGSASAAGSNALVPEGSEVYRIAADGLPSRLATLKDDVVYGLALQDGAVVAATGNHGRLYRIEATGAATAEGQVTDLVHLEASQATALSMAKDGSLLIGTSNGGKIFRVAPGSARTGTYTSEVFDAKVFSHFGRTEVRADSHGYTLFLRTGNVPSPLDGWSEWRRVAGDGAASGLPDGRFGQWKAELATGGSLEGVAVNYLPRNLAPVVDEVLVQPGARVTAAANAAAGNQTMQIQFPPPAPTPATDSLATPLAAQRDRTAITARWSAHDDNGDDLLFSVFFRGDGERNWKLLRDKVQERYLSFDSALLPDGSYRLKVQASDAPSHIDGDTLAAERVSEPFVIDTTPPVPGALHAVLVNGRIHAIFDARDALSPIAHTEYSVDAGDWQYLEPAGKISDSLVEHYDFFAVIPRVAGARLSAAEHVLAVRVFDRYENSSTVKTIVGTEARP